MKNSIQKKKYLVISFKTTTMAYYMEKLRKDENLEGRLIPLPKEISAGCGAAYATTNLCEEYWIDYMKQKNVEYDQMREILL